MPAYTYTYTLNESAFVPVGTALLTEQNDALCPICLGLKANNVFACLSCNGKGNIREQMAGTKQTATQTATVRWNPDDVRWGRVTAPTWVNTTTTATTMSTTLNERLWTQMDPATGSLRYNPTITGDSARWTSSPTYSSARQAYDRIRRRTP